MIYKQIEKLVIRNMEAHDVCSIVEDELEQGWNPTDEKYRLRLQDQQEGKAISLVAEYHGKVAGYINLYFENMQGPFSGMGLPEIVDFGVLEKYQNLGIGTSLMEVAEDIASKYADTVCLGVGLHSGYGKAQRMYMKRGYIPDGSGVWYNNKVCEQYSHCCNDDDLVLYMSKKLR